MLAHSHGLFPGPLPSLLTMTPSPHHGFSPEVISSLVTVSQLQINHCGVSWDVSSQGQGCRRPRVVVRCEQLASGASGDHRSYRIVVPSLSHVQLCDPMDCSTPGFTISWIAETHVHQVGDASNHLILCHPFLLPSVFSNIRVFSSELALHIRWPKYWSVSFSVSPSSEHSGLISFKMDWFDVLAVRGTLKSLLTKS